MSPSDAYYIAVQLGGATLAFASGVSRIKEERLSTWAVLLGVITNLAIQLPEGGPGLCVGMFIVPLMFVMIAKLGRGARILLLRIGIIVEPPVSNPDEPRCVGCGYLLIGLPGTVCPECGRQFTPSDETRQKSSAEAEER